MRRAADNLRLAVTPGWTMSIDDSAMGITRRALLGATFGATFVSRLGAAGPLVEGTPLVEDTPLEVSDMQSLPGPPAGGPDDEAFWSGVRAEFELVPDRRNLVTVVRGVTTRREFSRGCLRSRHDG
jgi:hypothetical protein